MYFIGDSQQPFIIFKRTMEFVAKKLGFLKYQPNPVPTVNIKPIPTKIEQEYEDLRPSQNRKTSQDDSSSNSSYGIGKLKITDTSDSDPNESKRVQISAPTPMVKLQTQSMGISPQVLDFNTLMARFHMSAFEPMADFSFDGNFYNNPYLSSLVAPYGTPTKFIGPITETERKEKVNKYLEKKKNRQWKNVKYTVRKELAESRKRVQGRFVKSERKWRWNEVMDAPVDNELQEGEVEEKEEVGEVKMEEEFD